MQNTNLKPEWATSEFRLDPFQFPQTRTYTSAQDKNSVDITINHRGAVLCKKIDGETNSVSIALPSAAFKGVAARAIDHGDGSITVTLELHHEKQDLCVPLLVAHNLDDIAADWRAWSEAFCIPMLMVEADGKAHLLEETMGKLIKKTTKPRRHYSHFADRRPRFLVRRSVGSMGVSMKIEGREIIARR